MDILAHNKTLTTCFIMPLLFPTKKFNEIITDFDSFVNAYIADFDKPENDNKIVLVFDEKQKNLPELNQTNHYTKKIKDSEVFAYVYEIPEDLSDNYAFWLMGRYSQFTKEAKEIVLNFWDAGENTLLYGALYKTGDAIKNFYKNNFNKKLSRWDNEDEELWIEPTLSKEIYGAE